MLVKPVLGNEYDPIACEASTSVYVEGVALILASCGPNERVGLPLFELHPHV